MKSQLFFMVCGACSGVFATASAQEISRQSSIASCATLPRIRVTPDSPQKTALNNLVKDVERLFIQGLYSQVIQRSSSQMGNGQLDGRLSYLRGVAAWRVGLFKLADKDLSRLGEFKPYENWASASYYATKIPKMKAILPTRASEIRIDGKVRFRVFSDKDSAWTDAIVKLLPVAYQINQSMIPKELKPTRVFLFERYEDFKAFYKLRGNGDSPGSWMWAAGDAGLMFFCPNVPGASPNAKNTRSDYFQSTIVHEFNHALVNSISGSAPMPMWLREGLATVVQNQASRANAASTSQRMRQALAVKAFLPLSEMSSKQQFVKNTEDYVAKSRQNIACADPYPQAYFMANYFLSLLPSQGLEPFLEELGRSRRFDELFQKHTRRTLDQFYREWLVQLPYQIGEGHSTVTKYALRQKADSAQRQSGTGQDGKTWQYRG